MSVTIEEMRKTIRNADKYKKMIAEEFGFEVPAEKTKVKSEVQDHGCCIVVLGRGFMYIGMLETDGEYLTIHKPKNIRKYTSGKGLLWHAANGSEDMVLDPYDGMIRAPYMKLEHFIPTKKSLWYEC